MKKKTFLLTAACTISMVTTAADFIKGGQFMDYILPLRGTVAATASDWGTASGSYVKKGETLTWPGTLGRWKDNGIEDTERSYWGGNAQKGDDGKYHIFVAGWPEASPKGHDTWKSGSRCYHGVSDKPDQGFVFKEELGAGHNTESYRLPDGRTVVYNIELRYISNETTLDENTTWTQSQFNWDKRDRRLSRGVDPTVSLSNCTFARRPDNSFLMMDRGGCVWVSRDGVDTYHQQTDHTAYAGNRTRYFEDPVIWYDGMQYFMVVNDYDARQAYLSRSLDGIHWVNEPGVAYKVGIIYNTNNNKKEDWFKIERPKVQTDAQGRATYIHFAVVDSEKDADKGNDTHSSKNIIAPLVKARFMEVIEPTTFSASTTTYKIKIKKEDDFDPTTISSSSLVFGSYDKANYGNGFKATTTETDSNGDLIVTFTGTASESGITADEWAPKVIGQTTSGNIVYGYAKLPWVNYQPAIVSALIPSINAENYISTVHVDNYGLSTSDEMTVKVLTTSGTVLSTGTVHAIAPYASEEVTLTGIVKPSAGISQIVIAFYKNGVEVDRNTIYTDDILAQQTTLATTVVKAKEVLDNNKYTTDKTALTALYNEGMQKLAWFDATQLKELNERLTNGINSYLKTNNISVYNWNFYNAALQDASITMTSQTASTLSGHQMKVADYMTMKGEKQNFYRRIAFDHGSGYLDLRNSGEGMNNTGLFNYNNDAYLSVLDLVPGDEVTFTLPDDKHNPYIDSENVYVKGDDTKTILAKGTEITSGTTYVVTGTQMDIKTYHYVNIYNINVETASKEKVSKPIITNDANFQVTITPGVGSAGTMPEGTWYTTDGTTPSKTNGIKYTVPFTVTKNTLIKTVTILPDGTASEIAGARATMPEQTWDFTNGTIWSNAMLIAGKRYDSEGKELKSGGVLLNFGSDKATFKYGNTQALWWLVSGSGTQPANNYLQVTVPAQTQLTVNTTGWSSERCYWYTVNGSTGSTATKFATSTNDRSHVFTNSTNVAQTYTIWVNNQFSGDKPQIHLSSLVMKDVSEVFVHKANVTYKCGDIVLGSYTTDDIDEFKDFTVTANAYIVKDGHTYQLDDDKFTGYSYTATMELEDQNITVNYKEITTGHITYYSEAESISNVSSNNNTTASGGKTAHANSGKMATLCTLPAGHYSINVGNVQDRDVYLRNANESDNTQNSILYWNKNQNDVKEFTLTTETQLALSGYTTSNGGLNQAGDIDFVLIQTTGIDVPAQTREYQTFASACALDFSNTITKAYIATSVADDKASMQQVTKVPANTGLLLQGTAAETIPVLTMTEGLNNVSTNLFIPGNDMVVEQETGYEKYILGEDNGTAYFFRIGSTTTTVAKDKAYLRTKNGADERLVIAFDDGSTGINDLTIDNLRFNNDAVYDMQGRQILNSKSVNRNLQHGMYIINGKKIIIK